MIQIGLALLAACGAGLIVAVCVGIWQLSPTERTIKATIEWPPSWEEIKLERGITDTIVIPEPDVIVGDWAILSPKQNHRHNLHCAKCGRFAKATDIPGVVSCLHHGLTTRITFVPDYVILEPSLAILSSVE